MHERRVPYETVLRWGSAATRQGTAKIASKPPGAGREAWNRFSLTVLRRNRPCQQPDAGTLASRTVCQSSLPCFFLPV